MHCRRLALLACPCLPPSRTALLTRALLAPPARASLAAASRTGCPASAALQRPCPARAARLGGSWRRKEEGFRDRQRRGRGGRRLAGAVPPCPRRRPVVQAEASSGKWMQPEAGAGSGERTRRRDAGGGGGAWGRGGGVRREDAAPGSGERMRRRGPARVHGVGVWRSRGEWWCGGDREKGGRRWDRAKWVGGVSRWWAAWVGGTLVGSRVGGGGLPHHRSM